MSEQNPFLTIYQTPHQTVPFNLIKVEHYEPAMREGMKREEDEINAIINNPEEPTFQNTIEALDRSGQLLENVTTVFGNLMSADTNDDMEAIAEKMIPILTEHSNNITLNDRLFQRIKTVYTQRESLNLNAEQLMLLEKTYDGFIRNGANLSEEDKQTFRKLNAEMGMLTLQFSQNLLKETHNYEMEISKEQLDGVPDNIIESFAENAKERGKEGYIVTLDAPSYGPFMKYEKDRELRKEIYMAYSTRCTHDNEFNNQEIVKKLINTRLALAQLLGYPTFADYVLKKRMAENKENVYRLLRQLLDAYLPKAKEEVAKVESVAKEQEGKEFKLMPWDWAFYSNILKNKEYQLNDEELRPYFELSQVKKGVFGLATRLYGITFKENKDIPVFNKDVTAYEVYDKDGQYLAVLYVDFFPRKGKHAGAWETGYKEQWIENGINSRPHASLTMNFTKPTADKPALLTFGEVETFLHEFGHSLHSMFANTTYASLSGTNVYWDFVELPSQFMENFAYEKEFLNTFARHYKTGEPIPDELIQKIKNTANYNIAYACIRQLSFGFLDMAWYTHTTPFTENIMEYEKSIGDKTRLLPKVEGTCMTVQFSHIMAGGYAAGYYSYKWAEVLDADAFSLFKEKGIFNQEVATSFRENILSKGGTEPPMVLYKRFRGQAASINALLRRNGIIK
ncbi:M3 family metallopeptidase [Phocaeicola oris]|uniref:M3 family metallopeptidase n=1 Tax=Phocaeicola oris TaxID=2896850 RepID=UPI00234F3875|nr:M3 family metallopeptidase [Phocaeicola oris]MCE2615665.1 M3 family metallopeptidase [Phocaeicola oris]